MHVQIDEHFHDQVIRFIRGGNFLINDMAPFGLVQETFDFMHQLFVAGDAGIPHGFGAAVFRLILTDEVVILLPISRLPDTRC